MKGNFKDLTTGKIVKNIDTSKMKCAGTICYGDDEYSTYIDEANNKRYEHHYRKPKTIFDKYI